MGKSKIEELEEQEKKFKETKRLICVKISEKLKKWAEKTKKKNLGFWVYFDLETKRGKKIGLQAGEAELEGDYTNPADDDYRRGSISLNDLCIKDLRDLNKALTLLKL